MWVVGPLAQCTLNVDGYFTIQILLQFSAGGCLLC